MRFLVLSLALLAGCSRPGSEKVLTIAVNAGVEGSALKAAAHEWGELRKTRIDVVELPYASLFEKELLDLESETGAYDVIMLDDPWFPKLVADSGLAPLAHAPATAFLGFSSTRRGSNTSSKPARTSCFRRKQSIFFRDCSFF